jgi:GAF domain-containing protein
VWAFFSEFSAFGWCRVSGGGARLREAQRLVLAASEPGSAARFCEPVLSVLPVQGAAVSLLTGTANHETLCATDAVAARLDELQFDLGEGPCWQALDSGRPVLVEDLRGGEHPSWPFFAAAAREQPVGAIFAFPLVVGALDLGALDVYRNTAGALGDAAVADGAVLADTLARAVLRRLTGDAGEDGLRRWQDDAAYSRREVHQATGMLSVQLQTTLEGGFAMLRARAFSTGRPVVELARDVVARRLRFDQPDA